jgi:hypothetical protein
LFFYCKDREEEGEDAGFKEPFNVFKLTGKV